MAASTSEQLHVIQLFGARCTFFPFNFFISKKIADTKMPAIFFILWQTKFADMHPTSIRREAKKGAGALSLPGAWGSVPKRPLNRHAAVDDDIRAGHKADPLRAGENNRLGDLIACAKPAQRLAGHKVLHCLRGIIRLINSALQRR